MANRTPKFLRHYTTIENLFKILDSGYLPLGDPENWQDKNDVAAMRAYSKLKGTKAWAKCFLDGDESIYHWQILAPKGCSITFDKNEIIKQTKTPNFLCGTIEYKKEISTAELTKLKQTQNGIKKIPFLKRNQYQCEKEFRIIWHGKGEPPKLQIKTALKSITLSPELPEKTREKLRDYIKEKYGWIKEVKLSRVLECEKWIRAFMQLV